MTLTTKQIAILKIVMAGNGSDPQTKRFSPVDLDQLLERLDYNPTKQSIQFSIRALMRHDLITKGEREQRRGRSRVTILATEKCRNRMLMSNPGMLGPKTAAPPLPDLAGVREADLAHSGDSTPHFEEPGDFPVADPLEEIVDL